MSTAEWAKYGGIVTENLVLHYNSLSKESYPKTGNVWKDLSGNGYDAIITGVTFNTTDNTFNFNSPATFNYGAYITGLNYVTGPSDQIENLTIECWCKSNSATATGNDDDERIILSFDRSSVFRFGIGKDTNALAEGKPHFGFDTSGGASDVLASSYGGDLRDDTWHQVVVTFIANETNGIKFYIDGSLVHTEASTYDPIGSQDDPGETPRYGWIGNGSEATTEGGTNGPDNTFYGFIGNLKYYYKTLSADEVLRNYNALSGRYSTL